MNKTFEFFNQFNISVHLICEPEILVCRLQDCVEKSVNSQVPAEQLRLRKLRTLLNNTHKIHFSNPSAFFPSLNPNCTDFSFALTNLLMKIRVHFARNEEKNGISVSCDAADREFAEARPQDLFHHPEFKKVFKKLHLQTMFASEQEKVEALRDYLLSTVRSRMDELDLQKKFHFRLPELIGQDIEEDWFI